MPGWFPYEIDITDSPEVRDLADELGILPVYARGHIADLKCYVFKQFQLGVIQGRNLEVKIAEGASWPGDPNQFIEKLLLTGFLHRSEDASPECCQECFPPQDNGLPYDPIAGAYIFHGWQKLIARYLEYQERDQIKRDQDKARQQKKRDAEKAKKLGILSVHEQPRSEYLPQRQGLRAAPRRVEDRIRHAIKSVTSRESLHDVTVASQTSSREAFLPSRPNGPERPLPTPLPEPSEPPKIPVQTTNTVENDVYSLKRDVTQSSRFSSRDVTLSSPEIDKQTKKPSFKNPLSLSLKDRERLKGGAAKKIAVAAHVDCKILFKQLYKTKTNEDLNDKAAGFLDKVIGRLHNGPNQFAYDEIGRRIEDWFSSSWTWVRKEWGYRPGPFEKNFDLLRKGPLEQREHSKRRTTKHGKFDTPPDKFTTTDDFGIS